MRVLTARDLDRIWFGCGNFGGIGSSPSLRDAGDSEEQALQLLDRARQVGLRRFDTANTYGGGASELVLGKWLRAQDPPCPWSIRVYRVSIISAARHRYPGPAEMPQWLRDNGCPTGEAGASAAGCWTPRSRSRATAGTSVPACGPTIH